MERENSDIRSGGGDAGERPSSSAASSSAAVAGDRTAAAAEEEKHKCYICNNEFRTPKALCGHMRTHPKSSRGVKPPLAEQQGRCDVRASAVAAEEQSRNVRESAAAEQSSIPVRKSAPVDQRAEEDVNPRRWESVVNQLLLLAERSPQWPQGDDGGSSENNITSHNSTARGGGGGSGGNGEVIMKHGFNEPANTSIAAAGVEAGAAAGVAVDAIIAAARNGTASDVKKKGSSSSSSSSAAGGSGAHTCEKCGRTFAMGQSLGGHMRKHYDGPPINTNKKRAREQPEETPAPTVDRRVREPAVPTAPLESHNPPALLSRSVQASAGGDCERNREEPERSPAGNGARRLLDFDLNKLPEPEEEEPENAPQQPEPERRDDDASLTLRLGPYDFRRSSGGV